MQIRDDGIQYETIDGKHERNWQRSLGSFDVPGVHGALLNWVRCVFGLMEGQEEWNIIPSVQDISDRFLSEVTNLGRKLPMIAHGR